MAEICSWINTWRTVQLPSPEGLLRAILALALKMQEPETKVDVKRPDIAGS